MTLKAVAVKDGYHNSALATAEYTVRNVPVPEDQVTISLGSVTAAAGDTASVPVYLFTDESRISELHLSFTFDKDLFENYVTITPAEGVEASGLFSSTNGGTVNLLYTARAGRELESGEICTLNFVSLASLPAQTTCDIQVDLEHSSVSTTTQGNVTLSAMDAVITLLEARIAQISTEVTFTTTTGQNVTKVSALQQESEIEASISFNDMDAAGDTIQTSANAYLALYDREGMMLSVDCWKVDLTDPAFLFIRSIQIPEDVEIGKIKIMILSDQMVPLVAASELAG